VLLAGATGAIAAAVSMMAGTFLEVQTANDQTTAQVAAERARYDADPEKADRDARQRLVRAGRARIGHCPVLPTIAQTVGIAAAAALAGIAVGRLIA
jgi:VIT family